MNSEFPTDPIVIAATRALNLGHPPTDIKDNLMARMGCDELQATAAIEQAAIAIATRRAAEKKATRTAGLWILGFGAIMLALAMYMGSGDVPNGRVGRLVMGYVVGSGASVVGIWLLLRGS